MSSDLPVIVSFWHGSLSWLERLCLGSFVRHGHPVDLYAFDEIADLPPGVRLRDAAELVPRERLVFYKGNGTPGVFSDLFRMTLLKAGRGVWADADVYCVRPLRDPPPYLFAWERKGSINGAVLNIPPDSALLDDLLSIFETTKRPLLERHLVPWHRVTVAARRMLGMSVPPEYMRYGSTGPAALTYHVRKRMLLDHVQPADVFYPLPYERIPVLIKRPGRIEDYITDRTIGVHLWRSQFTRRGRAGMPLPLSGSALATLCAREGVAVASAASPLRAA
jgi:hypothetical protein